MSDIKFSVIIPAYKAHKELELCLGSLVRNSGLDNEILVILGPGRFGKVHSKEAIQMATKLPGVTLIKTERDLGPYKSFNYGAELAKNSILCFYTDDQYLAPDWDVNIARYYRKDRILTSQLIEPGYFRSYGSILCQNFGLFVEEFDEKRLLRFCEKTQEARLAKDGYVSPLVMHKDLFFELGMWPTVASHPYPNDWLFRKKIHDNGFRIFRVMDSFSYHFQNSSYKNKKEAKTLFERSDVQSVTLNRRIRQKLKKSLKSLGFLESKKYFGIPKGRPGWLHPKKEDLRLALKYCVGRGIEIGLGLARFPNINAEYAGISGAIDDSVYPGPDRVCSPYDLSHWKDGSKDFVISAHMLEHMSQPVAALREWSRAVKNGGFLMLIIRDNKYKLSKDRRKAGSVAELIEDDKNGAAYPESNEFNLNEKPIWSYFHHFTPDSIPLLFEYLQLELVTLVKFREKKTGYDEMDYTWDDFTVVGRVRR